MSRAALVACVLALAPAGVAAAETTAATAPPPARRRPKKALPPYKPGPPDRAALAAAEDANLVPSGKRDGLTFAFALGSGVVFGSGLADGGDLMEPTATGTAGAISLRFGHVASRDAIVYVELTGRVLPYQFKPTPTMQDPTPQTQTFINNHTMLGIGGQNYIASAVWVRAGVALSNFVERERVGDGTISTRFDYGVAVVGGGGIDLVRRHSFALALEILFNAGMQFPGVIGSGGLALSVATY